MPEPQILPLTVGQTGLLLAALLGPLFLVLLLRLSRRQRTGPPELCPDWSLPLPGLNPQMGAATVRPSWTPAIKVGALLTVSFLLVALRSPFWSALALALVLASVCLTGTPWPRVLRRLAALGGLLLLLVLVLPLTSPPRPGDTILLLPLGQGIHLRLAGVFLALTIACKAGSIALLMEPMFAATELATTLQGCAALGLPPSLIQMILLCHRYLFVLHEELRRMLRAMRVRGFVPGTNLATLRTTGNGLGMLFIRSFERTERVHAAMLCRGYRGQLPHPASPPPRLGDWVKGVGVVLSGLVVLVLDRIQVVPW